MKKTAEQKLAELQRKTALAKQQAKGEDKRKDLKVGRFVRETMPAIESSDAFKKWLKTDLDRALFGVQSADVSKVQPPAIEATKAPTPAPTAAPAKLSTREISSKFSKISEKLGS